MLSITFHDLLYRYRQFLIAVVGAGVVFAMALLLTGCPTPSASRSPTPSTAWGPTRGSSRTGRPARSPRSARCPSTRSRRSPRIPGVVQADPLAIVPTTTMIDGETHGLRLMGHRFGGLGTPAVIEGRSADRRR